jgi:hypothetical protein
MLKVKFHQNGNLYYHIMCTITWHVLGHDNHKDSEVLEKIFYPLGSLFNFNNVKTGILKDNKTWDLELTPNHTIFKVKDEGHDGFVSAVMSSLYELGYESAEEYNLTGYGQESTLVKREDYGESEFSDFDLTKDLGLKLRIKRVAVPTYSFFKRNYIWFIGLWTQLEVETFLAGIPDLKGTEFQIYQSTPDPTFVVYVKYASEELFEEIIAKFKYKETSIATADNSGGFTSCFLD